MFITIATVLIHVHTHKRKNIDPCEGAAKTSGINYRSYSRSVNQNTLSCTNVDNIRVK